MSRHNDQVSTGDAPDDHGDSLLLSAKRRQLGVLLEYSPDAIVIVDEDGVVSEWNPAAEVLLGTPRPAALGAPIRALFMPPHGEHFHTAWEQLLAGGATPRFEVEWSPGGGPQRKMSVIVAPIRLRGALAGAVMIMRNLSAVTARAGSSISRSSPQLDSDLRPSFAEPASDGPAALPGLRWVERYLSSPPVTGTERGAAVFDIDVFAMVNSTYGPDAAEGVLEEFAELLNSLDTQGTFAHWRADVFVWLVDAVDPVNALNTCISILTSALEQPFTVSSEEVWLTLNIGLATDALVAGGDLLGAARDALQSAREAVGSDAVYYDASMEAGATSRFRVANDLRKAIEQDELRLLYQPILDFATNEIAGVEALVRWERPEVGLLAPDFFIGAAERTGQIIPLGNWVIRTACKNARLLGNHSGGPRTMSINVSARQLRDPALIDTLREAMVDGECAPSTIIIEVTESVLLHDLETVAASLEAIKGLDVGLDLDDFGTGYSSLQYLKNLPIDRLKVDQGFVAGLGVNSADTAIVASTIALAHALGLKAIAEGVETTEQLSLLREMGCDFAQGYLLSRPADMETLSTWLDAYVPPAILPTDATLVKERNKAADRRDTTADGRDTTANERERVADLRDAVASERENAEDDREHASGRLDGRVEDAASQSARSSARQDRALESAERKVRAGERARADKGRDAAEAGRKSRVIARAQDRSKVIPPDDEA